jgi:hypothetical protein
VNKSEIFENKVKKESSVIIGADEDKDVPLNLEYIKILNDFIANSPENALRDQVKNFINLIKNSELSSSINNATKNKILEELVTEYEKQVQTQKEMEKEKIKLLEQKQKEIEELKISEEKQRKKERKLQRQKEREEKQKSKYNKNSSSENPFLDNIKNGKINSASNDLNFTSDEMNMTKESKDTNIIIRKPLIKLEEKKVKNKELSMLKNLISKKKENTNTKNKKKMNDSGGWLDI